VKKALDVCVEGGCMVAVHPDGWRAVDGRFKDVQLLLRSNEVLYLELHDERDGAKTFGATTTYDFYCVRKKENNNFKSRVKGQNKTIINIELKNVEFIPNGMFNEIFSLVAKQGEEKVDVLHSYSSYETRKEWMSKEQTDEFKYPCVYTTLKDGTVNKFWSNTNEMGHFGIPKVIWSNGGATTPILDLMGEYGLTQFSYAIVDTVDNLPMIQRAMLSEEFIKIMSYADGSVHRYNRKAISTFRKDFWKEFLD
jgi:hypothetical protein